MHSLTSKEHLTKTNNQIFLMCYSSFYIPTVSTKTNIEIKHVLNLNIEFNKANIILLYSWGIKEDVKKLYIFNIHNMFFRYAYLLRPITKLYSPLSSGRDIAENIENRTTIKMVH